MGCCQTRDSNEIQFPPNESSNNQNQLTFGGVTRIQTKHSIKSNYNSNTLRNSQNGGGKKVKFFFFRKT